MRQMFLLIAILAPIICFGQDIENDIVGKSYPVPDSVSKNPANFSVSDSISFAKGNSHDIPLEKSPSNFELPSPAETIASDKNAVLPGMAVIPLWNNARFTATGDIQVMPGLMQIHSGSIGIYQNIGNFSLYLGAVANKYGYFNGLHTQYGVSGNIHYQFSPKLSFTGFGTYYFGKPQGYPLLPSMIGYYRNSNFGGYLSYQFNETFGVDVGAQTVQQFGTNLFRVEPIVTPTVKVGKVKIGLPVGQILHGIIRSQAEQRNHR
ncbi:MAG: hypothetical protein K2G77_02530 [Muribaculaceae bacterium]|nr:hypothetical protein [Muribaculaceae bacterium]